MKDTERIAELFIEEAKEARAEFVWAILNHPVTDNKELRTKADTLLIMYDQMIENNIRV